MKQKFTGGDIFKPQDGLPYYLHKTLIQNELYGGYGGYQLSNAKKASSGLSFGGNQYDLATNSHGRILFEKIAKECNKQGESYITHQELTYIKQHLYKPCKNLTVEEKMQLKILEPKINQMLSSPIGIEIINQDYAKTIVKKSHDIKNIISQIHNPHNRKILENDMALQMAIADIRNQHGSQVCKKLIEFLNQSKDSKGIIMYKTHKHVKIHGELDIEDLKAFRLATDYAINKGGAKNAIIRIENIKKIVANEPINESNYVLTANQKPKELGQNKLLISINQKYIDKELNKQQDKYANFNQIMHTILPNIGNNSAHLTSKFGNRILNHQHNYHYGIDLNYIGGQKGINLTHPNIYAPICGTVIMVGGKYGTIKILDKNGFSHEILHTNKQKVTVGQEIKVGDVIATMGNTAPKDKKITDQHVHYQIKKYSNDYTKAQIFNPIDWWAIHKKTQQIYIENSRQNSVNFNDINKELIPINLDKNSSAYKMIQDNISNTVIGFNNLNINQQDEIIKSFIHMQNKALIDKSVQEAKNTQNLEFSQKMENRIIN